MRCVFPEGQHKILAEKEILATAWATSKDTINFTTDSEEDYRIEFWNESSKGDLVLDNIIVDEGTSAQEIPKDVAFPDDKGTVLLYSHQDDDLIWMLPFWDKVDKFVCGVLPTTPSLQTVIREQQNYIDSSEYKGKIDYQNKVEFPFGEISDNTYHDYYWYNRPEANPGENYVKSQWDTADSATTKNEVEKIKNKIRPYFSNVQYKRFITHNIWGEYGHQHHLALNQAVRELAVEYGKDVYMLGNKASYDRIESLVPIPEDVRYTTGTYDPALYKGCRQAYKNHNIKGYPLWTWGEFVPDSTYKYPLIVDNGIDLTDKYNAPADDGSPKPDERGVYTFKGDSVATFHGTKNEVFTIAMSILPDKNKNMAISTVAQKNDPLIQDRDFRLNAQGKLEARVWDGKIGKEKILTSSTVIPTDTWTNIVFTGDGTDLNLYINGQLEATLPGVAYTGYQSATSFYVGGVTRSYYTGLAGDIGLTETFSTEEDVKTIYRKSLASDRTEDYVFDGSNSITVAGTKSKNFAISMAIKPSKLQNGMGIYTIEQIDDKMIQDRELRTNEDGTMNFMVYDAAAGRQIKITADAKLSIDKWTHVILSGDASKLSVYVNGVLDQEIEGEAYAGYAKDVQLRLGWIYNASNFIGAITDLEVLEKYVDENAAWLKFNESVAYTATNTDELINKIDQAKKEAEKTDLYTDVSIAVLKAEIEKAEEALLLESLTPKQVDIAVTNLQKAIDGLERLIDPPPADKESLKRKIEEAKQEASKLDVYTAESIAILNSTISDAEALLAVNPDQIEVENTIAEFGFCTSGTSR